MSVELGLEVIEIDGVKLFELVDGGVTVHFNKVSSDIVGENRPQIPAVSSVENDGDVEFYLVRSVDVANGFCANDFEVGQRIMPFKAKEAKGHKLSAARLVVDSFRKHGLAVAKLEFQAANDIEFAERSAQYTAARFTLNEAAKAAVQPSVNPPILLFK